ncbi:hypothetical protein ACFWGI_37965 [Streptomyces niveus]|uniref:hypothetical protein n=1 Tax=Streptomyces niveus TaxID=193462 RepID=UPI003646D9E3
MTTPTPLAWTRFTSFTVSTQELKADLSDEAGARYQLTLNRDDREALGRIVVDPPGADVEPLNVQWDKAVTIARDAGGSTTIPCLAAGGQRVDLILDDRLREDLGLLLTDPWDKRVIAIDRTANSTTYTVTTEDDDTSTA